MAASLSGLYQRSDAVPVLSGLSPPLAGVDFVGQRAGQFGGKAKIGRCLPVHSFECTRFGHLIPGEIQLGDRKVLGVEGQHIARFRPRRIKPGIGPLRI